jgi:uncharacterized membrane protein YesL
MISSVSAEERISFYDIVLNLAADGTLTVTERLTVQVEGQVIERGIYRDIPTHAPPKNGFFQKTPIEVVSVRRNQQAEPYFIEKRFKSLRLYIGQRNVLLPQGTHSFEIVYKVERVVDFAGRLDGLNWNAIGLEWQLPIDRARVLITLPKGAHLDLPRLYYGSEGSQDFVEPRLSPSAAEFELNQPLLPGQGSTLTLNWQKALVEEPSGSRRILWLVQDNFGSFLGFFGVLALFGYYLRQWLLVGRDPIKGERPSMQSAPEKLSPVAVGYIYSEGLRGIFPPPRAMVVAIIHLAIKGYVELSSQAGADFTLLRTAKPQTDLPLEEKVLLNQLFEDAGSVEIGSQHQTSPRFFSAKSAFCYSVDATYGSAFFRSNRGRWAVALPSVFAIIVLTVLCNYAFSQAGFAALFLTLIFTLCLLITVLMIQKIILMVSRQSSFGHIFQYALLTLFISLFILAVSGLNLGFIDIISWPALCVVLFAVIGSIWFYRLLEAPTPLGQKARQQIEGYKHFLTGQLPKGAETDTTDFERHLPYAIALGIERRVLAQFEKSLAASALPAAAAYQPSWMLDGQFLTAPLFDGVSPSFADTLSSALSVSINASAPRGGRGVGSGFGGGGGGGW